MHKRISMWNAIAFIFLAQSLFSFFGCNSNSSEESYEIKNGVFTRTISYNMKSPGPIIVNTCKSSDAKSLLVGNTPYFELVVNNEIITSLNPVWVLNTITTRSMGNGGTEHKLVFTCQSSAANGLEIVIYQQSFPNSTLVREKLELIAPEGREFQLNKVNGQLHFKFPQYSVRNNQADVNAKEIRLATWEKEPITFGESEAKPKGNHMFYPDIRLYEVADVIQTVKGPINIVSNGEISWLTAYEHASQDNTNGLFRKQDQKSDQIVDAMQGVKGKFNFPVQDDDFKFLGISSHQNDDLVSISVDMLRGGYLNGELITNQRPYSTVWTASAFCDGHDIEDGKEIIRNYLFNQICEKKAARQPEFYYNTWGMQREISHQKPELLRGIFTYDRIFEEIDYAHQLGVDLFVLDDGWEQTQGLWTPNRERLPQGLKPIKQKLDEYGMKMGVWFSPMGIDSTSERYKSHQDWVIKDSEGDPILAQWDHPAFDFVGPFFDIFIEDCKKLIDEGARFFKWDAINTFYSQLPNLHHGSDQYSDEEIRARYEYLLPIYVTRAMEILTEYEPDLVIEMDLTEARRVMTGLAPISQGKLFFMNNGASWYNDYSSYRAMSMRTIINEYNGLIPLELFTYANYPHNLEQSMRYNVNNSLIAGHGFWGNLALMTDEERLFVGEKVSKSKRVLPYLCEVNTQIEGKVGDTPEIYVQLNEKESAGQIFIFANENVKVDRNVTVETDKLLCVLDHPYTVAGSDISFSFDLKGKASTDEAFIIPNGGSGISILSSTCNIDDVKAEKGKLEYDLMKGGEQTILWNGSNGKPVMEKSDRIKCVVSEASGHYIIKVSVTGTNSKIIIQGS